MSEAAGLSKKSNHSARKTAIQTLLPANVSLMMSLYSYPMISRKISGAYCPKNFRIKITQKSKYKGCILTAAIATNHDQETMFASSQTTVAMQTLLLAIHNICCLMVMWLFSGRYSNTVNSPSRHHCLTMRSWSAAARAYEKDGEGDSD